MVLGLAGIQALVPLLKQGPLNVELRALVLEATGREAVFEIVEKDVPGSLPAKDHDWRSILRAGGSSVWPRLPANHFVSGRAATADDVRQSRAIFYTSGVSYASVGIAVPQYCYFKSGAKRTPCILAQTEPGKDGGVVIGLIRLDDYSSLGATLSEVDLLGTVPPEPKKSGLLNRLFGGSKDRARD